MHWLFCKIEITLLWCKHHFIRWLEKINTVWHYHEISLSNLFSYSQSSYHFWTLLWKWDMLFNISGHASISWLYVLIELSQEILRDMSFKRLENWKSKNCMSLFCFKIEICFDTCTFACHIWTLCPGKGIKVLWFFDLFLWGWVISTPSFLSEVWIMHSWSWPFYITR